MGSMEKMGVRGILQCDMLSVLACPLPGDRYVTCNSQTPRRRKVLLWGVCCFSPQLCYFLATMMLFFVRFVW